MKWIPCEERSPEEEDWYLVTIKDLRGRVYVAQRWYSKRTGFEYASSNEIHLAWSLWPAPAPYPAPYKGRE